MCIVEYAAHLPFIYVTLPWHGYKSIAGSKGIGSFTTGGQYIFYNIPN